MMAESNVASQLAISYPQAIDALALCDVDGRMFLEMDEEDLAESDELGLDVSLGGSPALHRIYVARIVESCSLCHGI